MADLLQGSDVFDGSRGDVEDGPHHSSGSGENEDARKLSGDLSLRRRDESDFGHFRNSKKSNNYLSSLTFLIGHLFRGLGFRPIAILIMFVF